MKKISCLSIAILLFFIISPKSHAATWYVTSTGTGTLAGASWTNAASDLQLTINNASSGDEIWVTNGTYKPNRRADALGTITLNNRNNAFVLKSGVKIYGGFNGTESSLTERNWIINTTTLSGDLGTIGTKTDNAYHVVISSDAVDTAELNGFIITQGYAENWSTATINSQIIETCNGGGIICASSSPVLKNLNINNCYSWYGGGIHNTASSPLLIGVIVDSNTGVKNGGGVFNTSSSSPSIINTIIRNNITVEDWTKGGGIYNASSSNPTITNSLIYKNNSHDGGGGIYSSGSTPILTNVTIVYNTMSISGGTGGGVSGTMTLQNCLIWGNKASTSTNNVSGTPTYANTLVEGISGTGIISNSNPLFVDASAENYRLTSFSPAINKGSNILNTTLTDLDENSRIFSGEIIDLGAYEYQSADANFLPDANGILYVKKGSNGNGDSWSNAIGELSDALFVAGGLSSVTQIWVAAGTYFPTYAAGNGTTERDKAFVLINNVMLYGGFAGTETTLSQRSINVNATILSGDIGSINVTTDDCYHVLISAGTVGTACLDGFTITKGNANGSSNINLNTYTISQGSGGGIHLATSDPTFSNLTIINNKATLGGGVSLANSTTTFSNSKIDSNTSTTNGGGIYCYISTFTLTTSELTNNTAVTNGGGIYTTGSESYLSFINITVKNNISTSGSGGGMYLNQINNSSPFKGLLIFNNQAGQYGGGIYKSNSFPTFTNLTLTANKAGTSGGGLYMVGDYYLINSIVWGNTNSNTSAIDNLTIGTSWYYNNTLIEGATLNGTNIISNSDPQFINPATGDYHLTSTSPAKDAGNNSYISGVSTDLDGLTRVFNTNVDLGAYEFAPATTYVTPTGAGTGTGTSWANASSDLQLMINNSNSGGEIWVAAGTYKPNRRADALGTITLTSKYNAFVLKSGVKIFGGFAGNETSLSQQNWTANATTLSGDINTVGDATDNTYHVVISSGAVGTAELNGFTIRDGYADIWWDHIPVNGIEVNTNNGGGIACYSSSPILTNLNISNCRAWKGAGVFNDHSSPTLTEITITSNNVTENGGGMYNASSSPILMNVLIQSNSAQNDGGGIMNESSSPSLTKVTITSNTTLWNGGGMFNSNSSPTIINAIISNNTSSRSGGGICNKSGSSPIIKNALIYKNTCLEAGGGVFDESSTSTITNATIVYNSGNQGNGGGVFGNGIFKNSIIWGNTISGSINNASGTLTYSNTLLQGGSGTGIISNADPLFVNSVMDNYRLTSMSPALELGNNTYISGVTTDLDEGSRIFNANVDLGAFESHTYPIQVAGAFGIADGTGCFTLKAAFDAINAQANQAGKNIVLSVNGTTRETATASLNAGSWTTLKIRPTVSGLTIGGSLDAPLITLNGADNVTIDGRINETGSTRDLTIVNTNTGGGANTFTFTGNAQSNTIRYCRIEGSSVGVNGTIYFADGSITNGNGLNTISNNVITNSGGNRAAFTMVSGGASSFPNTANFISNNEFKDFFNPSTESCAIYARGYNGASPGTRAWTITGNSFYETTSFAPSNSSYYYIVKIGKSASETGGYGFTISDNFIGGSAAQCGGSAWLKTSSQNNPFIAFGLYLTAGTATSIQNNTIKNVSWSNSGGATGFGNPTFVGMDIYSGDTNIGTVTGNTIGAATGTGSILVGASNVANGNGAEIYGIRISTTGTVDCQNNILGSITTSNTAATNAAHFYGIYKTASLGTTTINNNTIGSSSTANSINANSSSTSHDQHVYGVFNQGSSLTTISNNTIANLTNGASSTNTANQAYINGIRSETGSAYLNNTVVRNNTVHDITIGCANNNMGISTSVAGIMLLNSDKKIVTGNTIYNLSNTYESFSGDVAGIYLNASNKSDSITTNTIYGLSVTGANATTARVIGLHLLSGASTNLVSQNFIHSLSVPFSTSASLYGMYLEEGMTNYSNNIISLFNNTPSAIYGIYENGLAGKNSIFHFNTVNIAGTPTAGSLNSYALYSNTNVHKRGYRNNIFSNQRTNNGASGKNYAIWFNYNDTIALSLSNNIYYTPGAGGVLSHYNGVDVAALPLITGIDVGSYNFDPQLTNPTGLTPASYKQKLGCTGGTSSITIDFENTKRSADCIGAFEALYIEVWKESLLQAKYGLLKMAFDAINAGTHTGALEMRITGNTFEKENNFLNASGTGSSSYSSLLIYPTVSGCSITTKNTITLFGLKGANNVTLDGRVNQSGLADLTLSNSEYTNYSSKTIVFTNNACLNTIKYCYIKGSCASSTGGIIHFLGATTGNNNNIIDHCYITNAGIRPTLAIVSNGTALYPNSGNVISNNNIYDVLKLDGNSKVISIGTGSTDFSITGNSFYETTPFMPTAIAKYSFLIGISNTSGNNFSIKDNYLGGSAPLCGGSPFTVNTTQSHKFRAINVSVGSATATTIENNTIENFNYTSSSSEPWCGIYLEDGLVNVGTENGNTIGATTGTGSITVTNPSASATSYGIYNLNTSQVTVSKNKIGSITTVGTGTVSHGFIGIYKGNVSGDWTISANTIGSTITPGSIQTSSASTSATGQVIIGIQSIGTSSTTISTNTIANLHNAYAGTNTSAKTRGIEVGNGANNIQNNVIRDISSAGGQVASDVSASVIGIVNSSYNITNQIIQGNSIYNLSNTNPSAKVDINGIATFIANTNPCIISNNFIHSLSLSSSDLTSTISGIFYNKGLTTIANNIINLGAGVTRGYTINGINNQCSYPSSILFNTIYLTGTVTGTSSVTYALNENLSINSVRNYSSNIFYNSRTSTNPSVHYAIGLAGSATYTINNNDYLSPTGTIGSYNSSAKNDLALWKTATGQDARSLSIDPLFVNPGSTVATDYKIGLNLFGVIGSGITTDYELATRGTYTAMGAWERPMNDNHWNGSVSSVWSDSNNWNYNIIPPNNEQVTFTSASTRDCVLDVDVTISNITNAYPAYKFVLNGHKAAIKGSFYLSNGAQIDASATGSIVEFTGSLTQTIPFGTFVGNNIYNLSINNSNNVTFTGSLNLLNTISAAAGKLDAMTNSPTISYAGSSAQLIDSIPYLNGKAYNLTIDNAVGVSLSNDFVVDHLLTINSGKLLTIPTAKKLNVLGTITNNAGISGLVIKSASNTPNGTLIFHNTVDNPVYATVEMYSKAYYDINGPAGYKYKWQYFGIPLRSVSADPTFTGSYVRKYNESGVTYAASWISLNNTSSLTSLTGYEITQTSPKIIYFKGILENRDLNRTLSYTLGSYFQGQHIITNPYAAAIDIKQLNFTNTIETISIYNTGSNNDWLANSNIAIPGLSPGQYISIPKFQAGLAGLPDQIPSMQGFMVSAYSPSGVINIPYSSTVMKNSKIQRLKKEEPLDSEEQPVTIIDLKGSYFSDRIWLFTNPSCTHNFDNGYDGIKVIGTTENPQIYAIEADGNYQVNSADDINDTYLALQSNQENTYTITFTHQNRSTQYPELYLTDLLNGQTIDISQSGSSYIFNANPGSITQKRFRIGTSKDIGTNNNILKNSEVSIYITNKTIHIQNNTYELGKLSLFDGSGKLIENYSFKANGETVISTNLKTGIYSINAVYDKNMLTKKILINN